MGFAPRTILDQARACLFLRGLPEGSLQCLARMLTPRSVQRGKAIFIAGEAATGLYLVVTGAVKIFSIANDGREVTYDTLGSGSVFGVLSALDGAEQMTSASAVSDATLLFIARKDFLLAMRSDNLVQVALLAAVANRCRTLSKLLEEQRLDGIETRLARTVLRVNAALGEEGVPIAMTQLQLGSMAGISRERASRLLKNWRRCGIIAVRGGAMTILSHHELQLLAGRRLIH